MIDSEKYQQFLIKEFKHWRLYLHQNQSAIGRTYLWAIREDAQSFPRKSLDESAELDVAILQVENAINSLWQPDLYNYEFLGNETVHLHGHIVPRYSSRRQFAGIEFDDPNFGARFVPKRGVDYPPEVLFQIRDTIKEALNV